MAEPAPLLIIDSLAQEVVGGLVSARATQEDIMTMAVGNIYEPKAIRSALEKKT